MSLDPAIQSAQRQQLAGLLKECVSASGQWDDADAERMFEQELDAAVPGGTDPAPGKRHAEGPGPADSLRSLLQSRNPDPALVWRLVTYYEACALHPEASLPPAVATRLADSFRAKLGEFDGQDLKPSGNLGSY